MLGALNHTTRIKNFAAFMQRTFNKTIKVRNMGREKRETP